MIMGTGLLLRGLIRVYQLTVSPLIPGTCRHWPTCSEYARQAIATHGAAKGSWLATKRLARCQPWGTWGYDPVPDGDQHLPGRGDAPRV